MPQWYETRHIEAALAENDTQPRDLTRLAQFCMQICHLERCYAEKGTATRAMDDIIPLELFRFFTRHFIWPTSGQLKAMTMAYQDLLKGRTRKGKQRCMSRIKDIRIERSISIVNVRGLETTADHMMTHPHMVRPSDVLP